MLSLLRRWVTVSGAIAVALSGPFLSPLGAASVRGPAIVTHPQSQIAAEGQTVVFTVTATGEGQLSYRWLFNGKLMSAKTNSMLVISNVSTSDAGNYSALVLNAHGATLSRPATLTVGQPTMPIITEQPQSDTVAAGASVTLSVGYTGTGPFYFQWRRNGVNIPGATDATLHLDKIQPDDAGDYSVVVFTDAGAMLSQPAAIRVVQGDVFFSDSFAARPTITANSGSGASSNTLASVESSEPAHAGKTGGRSVWIAWQPTVSGIATVSLSGSSFDTLLAVYTGNSLSALTQVAADDDSGGFLTSRAMFNVTAGTVYNIAVDGLSGAAGTFAFAWSLEETADRVPEIVMQPIHQAVAPGDSATFSVEAVGDDLSFQWLFNGQALAGAAEAALTIPVVDETHVGLYSVRVTSGSRSVESSTASLQLNINEEGAQSVLSADKLADAIRLNQPLRLGEVTPAVAPVATGVAAAAGINRGYTGSQVFTTFGAVSEPGEPLHCNVQGGASQWIVYVADHDGDLDLNTDGSGFDTILAVYSGPGTGYSTLQPVGCDNNSGSDGRDSRVKVKVQRGQTYYIVVDGVNGAHGKVRLNYSLATPATLTVLSRTATETRLRLAGQKKGTFLVESSSNQATWTAIVTNTLPTGVYEFTHSGNSGQCLYRARTLQP